jgi:hypothetical protein
VGYACDSIKKETAESPLWIPRTRQKLMTQQKRMDYLLLDLFNVAM